MTHVFDMSHIFIYLRSRNSYDRRRVELEGGKGELPCSGVVGIKEV